MSRDCVFVVRRDDELWDAACFDGRCGEGLHGIGDGDGICRTESAARRAASAHRRELAAMPDRHSVPATVCPTCGHRNVPKEATR